MCFRHDSYITACRSFIPIKNLIYLNIKLRDMPLCNYIFTTKGRLTLKINQIRYITSHPQSESKRNMYLSIRKFSPVDATKHAFSNEIIFRKAIGVLLK